MSDINKLAIEVANKVNLTNDRLVGTYELFKTLNEHKDELKIKRVNEHKKLMSKVKEHIDVLELEEIEFTTVDSDHRDLSKIIYTNQVVYNDNGQTTKQYLLDKNFVMSLLSNISIPFSHALVKRLNGLENQLSTNVVVSSEADIKQVELDHQVKLKQLELDSEQKDKDRQVKVNFEVTKMFMENTSTPKMKALKNVARSMGFDVDLIKPLEDSMSIRAETDLNGYELIKRALPIRTLLEMNGYKNPTKLVVKVNKALETLGYQIKVNDVWIIKDNCMFGYNMTHEKKKSSNPVWYVAEFNKLINLIKPLVTELDKSKK